MIKAIAIWIFSAYLVYFLWCVPKHLREIAEALKILAVMKHMEVEDGKNQEGRTH